MCKNREKQEEEDREKENKEEEKVRVFKCHSQANNNMVIWRVNSGDF